MAACQAAGWRVTVFTTPAGVRFIDPGELERLTDFGQSLGLAFQVIERDDTDECPGSVEHWCAAHRFLVEGRHRLRQAEVRREHQRFRGHHVFNGETENVCGPRELSPHDIPVSKDSNWAALGVVALDYDQGTNALSAHQLRGLGQRLIPVRETDGWVGHLRAAKDSA